MSHDQNNTQNNTYTHGCCGGNDAHHHTASDATSYTCSMHPNVKQDKPGSCPECGMNLVPEKKIEN